MSENPAVFFQEQAPESSEQGDHYFEPDDLIPLEVVNPQWESSIRMGGFRRLTFLPDPQWDNRRIEWVPQEVVSYIHALYNRQQPRFVVAHDLLARRRHEYLRATVRQVVQEELLALGLAGQPQQETAKSKNGRRPGLTQAAAPATKIQEQLRSLTRKIQVVTQEAVQEPAAEE